MGAFRASRGRRGAGYRFGGGLLALVVLSAVVLIGSVQAAPSTKNYTANVHVTDATHSLSTFTVTLTNDQQSNQTFGSANITPPTGFAATGATTSRPGWTATVDSIGVIELRSTSNAVAKGQSVAATVTIDPASITGCGSAAWSTAIKQSNDFSGTKNDFFLLQAGTDLTPLGSFVFAPIETVLPGGIHVPQILTNAAAPISVTAKDTCGNPDAGYSGAALAPLAADPPRLVNASFSALGWSGGGTTARTGSATLTPTDVEAQDNVVVTDPTSKISATSAAFDVVEKICAVTGSTCTWTNKKGTITATSTVGSADSTGDTASLGLGFRSLNATCTIAGKVTSSFGDGIQIVPVHYSDSAPYTVTLTYAKSVAGNGPASGFNVCKSTDNGLNWTPIPQCGKVPVAPCADPSRTSTGALQIILYLEPGDPFSGGFG